MIEAGGQILMVETEIINSVAVFFQHLLTSDVGELAQSDFYLIHSLPNSLDLATLCSVTQVKEVRDADFGISEDSVSGHYWDTVGSDVIIGTMWGVM